MRYLPLTTEDRAEMLARIGVPAVDDLFADIPAAVRETELPHLDLARGELEVERTLARLAGRNVPAGSVPFFVGAGAYRHHVPASVDHLIQRSEFLTSYTPYQPEIAQGTLQYLFEFQTQVAELTAMEVANASMYDGSTAAAEAVLMAHRVTKRRKALLAGNLHPHYRATIETLSRYAADQVVALQPVPAGGEDILAAIDAGTSCVVVQSPDVFGNLVDLKPIAEAAHKAGALLIAVFTEAVSLGLVEPPGTQGADIVVGEGQSIGNALNFGGPYVGLFATRQKFVRQMPGRLAGETVDAEGRRGFVLTLSTREQHIRREKATSNICTNSGLCALAFTIHLSLLGQAGLTRLARLNHAAACDLADRLASVPGVSVVTDSFFNEFTVRVPGNAADVVEKLAARGILAGVPYSRLAPKSGLDDLILVAATEVTTEEDRAAYAAALKEVVSGTASPKRGLGASLERALNRAARWMATYPNSIEDEMKSLESRVSAGVIEVLIDEGFLGELIEHHPDVITAYCRHYYGVDPNEINRDKIEHIVDLSDEGTNEERFQRLYEIAKEIA